MRYAFYPYKYQNNLKSLNIHPVTQLQPVTSKAGISAQAVHVGLVVWDAALGKAILRLLWF